VNPAELPPAPDLPAALDRALPAGTTGHLSEDELYYAERARAENTRRGYRSDLADFSAWCQAEGHQPLPAEPATVSAYLIWLARHEAKVSTISRRLSSIAYAHRFAGLTNPVDHPRVSVVWEGIRRQHAADVDQAPPLMPPPICGTSSPPCPPDSPALATALCCSSGSSPRCADQNWPASASST